MAGVAIRFVFLSFERSAFLASFFSLAFRSTERSYTSLPPWRPYYLFNFVYTYVLIHAKINVRATYVLAMVGVYLYFGFVFLFIK